jgi:DNA-directed RNA polymerase subunit RPC12/RpoP
MSIKIKVSASGLEFDPEKETAPVNCPECKTSLGVTFAQVQREETVTCKSCKLKSPFSSLSQLTLFSV